MEKKCEEYANFLKQQKNEYEEYLREQQEEYYASLYYEKYREELAENCDSEQEFEETVLSFKDWYGKYKEMRG
jgi:hypothetical protein